VANNRTKHKDFKIRITARAAIDVETSCVESGLFVKGPGRLICSFFKKSFGHRKDSNFSVSHALFEYVYAAHSLISPLAPFSNLLVFQCLGDTSIS